MTTRITFDRLVELRTKFDAADKAYNDVRWPNYDEGASENLTAEQKVRRDMSIDEAWRERSKAKRAYDDARGLFDQQEYESSAEAYADDPVF